MSQQSAYRTVGSPKNSQAGSSSYVGGGSRVGTKGKAQTMEQARLDNFRNYAEGQGLIASRYETEINPMTKSFVSSGLYKSTIYETLRGLASLPDNRMGQISKKFMQTYGNTFQINLSGLLRIQNEAYSRCSDKIEVNDETARELQKTMDWNRDGRVTEQDVLSLCRRYLSCEKRPINYTPMVQQQLAVARRLFNEFDVQKRGYLTVKQVPALLSATYKALQKDFTATQQDVKSWMKLTDHDGDGHVRYPEYEQSIIRAMRKQGIQIFTN